MKNVFNLQLIQYCGNALAKHQDKFDVDGFCRLAAKDIDQNELKERSQQICEALVFYLPNDYLQAVALLVATLHPVTDNQELDAINTNNNGVAGWLMMPYSQFVGEFGSQHLTVSLSALAQFTKRFTSEFGIRELFISQPMATLAFTKTWLVDPCHHVRRLASEGCRPLLPWAKQIPLFKEQPELILPILEALKDDDSEYVRRSVANNLNDIAKHHPQLVADLMHRWSAGASKPRQRLIKHASRTLIKQGHPTTLATFGFGSPKHLSVQLNLEQAKLALNEKLLLNLTVTNNSACSINILLDFVVFHQKANGRLTPKVFKWKELTLAAHECVALQKFHHIKPISTRKYYPGEHQIAVQINGQEFSKTSFELTM